MDQSNNKRSFVLVPNKGEFNKDDLIETAEYLRQLKWTYKVWKPTPALIGKSSGSSAQYVGQHFDSHYFDLVQDGWTHDHCEIYTERITNIPEYGSQDGYEADNGDWICKDCYTLFIAPADVRETIKTFPGTTN